MTTTYCLPADVDFLLTETGTLRRVDDDEDGDADGGADEYVENAIEIGAVEMNAYLEMRYRLSDLASNAWCKWTNAYFAVYALDTRAAGAASPQVKVEYEKRLEMLKEIQAFRIKLPEQDESFDFTPTVTNYESELMSVRGKVRVVEETSTGGPLPDGMKRQSSFGGYGWW